MTEKPTIQALKPFCRGAGDKFITMHLKRLADRYFEWFTIEEIGNHISILASLSIENPVTVQAKKTEDGRICCTVLSFNYVSLFAVITGTLASTGFNIHDGNIFTYSHSKSTVKKSQRFLSRGELEKSRYSPEAVLERRKVVDCFYGDIKDPDNLESWLELIQSHLIDAVTLLEEGKIEKSRQLVHEWVIQNLSSSSYPSEPMLYPLHMDFDNSHPSMTLLKVTSEDTPAFLYSLSIALSIQEISIERVSISTSGSSIQDEVWFADNNGKKIEDLSILNNVRFATLFIKQFTYFLSKSPDPYSALIRFDQLIKDVSKLPEKDQWLERLSNPRYMEDLANVLGTSDFMWEDFIRIQHEMLIPILEPHVKEHRFFDPDRVALRLYKELKQVQTYEEKVDKINEFKDREIFLIDLDQILKLKPGVESTRYLGDNLTLLAEHIIKAAVETVYEHLVQKYGKPRTVGHLPTRFALFGLGKFGAESLGYASDIELLLVYRDSGNTDGEESIKNSEFFEKFVQELIHCIRSKREGIMTIDLQLRPYGNDGPLACSMESFCRYYGQGGSAHSYERLALVRLRRVAGDKAFGEQIERLRDEFIYSPRSIKIDEIREIRLKQYAEKANSINPNAKFSPGALVDLEYDIQILQVIYGKDIPELKTPFIGKALHALANIGILSEKEKESLIGAYYFLRRLINGLRMLRGNAKDLFLPPLDSTEFVHLARRIGYIREKDLEPEAQLYMDFATRTASVRAFVERHFGRASLPDHNICNVADLILYTEAPHELKVKILSEAGFKNTHRAFTNLKKLASLCNDQNQFASLAVLGFDFLKRKSDPDMALNNWECFVSTLKDPENHFSILLVQPKRLDILFSILSCSQFIANTLIRNTDFFDWVTSPEILKRRFSRKMLEDELRVLSNRTSGNKEWMDMARRFRRREILRIVTRELVLAKPVKEITYDLSCLADALIQSAFERIRTEFIKKDQNIDKFCLIALGKLGGMELNYSSDIDLLGFYNGSKKTVYFQVMERIRDVLSSHTEEGYIYRVDYRLRPYGTSGELIYSLKSLVKYYKTKASIMEIQSLLKARPVTGNPNLGVNFTKEINSIILQQRSREDITASIEYYRIKAINNVSKQLTSTMDIKNDMGGIRDIEFLVQGLQLIYAPSIPALLGGNTLEVLSRFDEYEKLNRNVVEQIKKDYIFLRRVEHSLQIVEDQQTHTLPSDPEALDTLAKRVLGEKANHETFMKDLELCIHRVHGAYKKYLKYSFENSIS
jgi:glutamate-ammonia-ligase adenylyltransferase